MYGKRKSVERQRPGKKIRPEGLIQYDNRRLHQGLSHLHQFD